MPSRSRTRPLAGRRAVALCVGAAVALTGCSGDVPPRTAVCATGRDGTVARQWVVQTLEAVRLDFPAPTFHARNLFHLSAAMWDAWAAWDPAGRAAFIDAEPSPLLEGQTQAQAQELAVAHAAWVVARARYAGAHEGERAVRELDQLAEDMCLDLDPPAGTAARLGVDVARQVLDATAEDGHDDRERAAYEPVNPPLVVGEPGADLVDVQRWQPLEFVEMVTQNGIPLETNVQEFVGPHWGWVDAFALPPADEDGVRIDPGPPPGRDEPDFLDGVIEVLRASSRLDPALGEPIDISPASLGNNPLGTNDGDGHDLNPVTGRPYEPQLVPAGDHLRVIAEFWADGPTSETPPGHWYSIAHLASDRMHPAERAVGGRVLTNDELEWDVKLHLVLGGALHDAAVAAWGVKRHHDTVRPISLIRYFGGLGQSSDPEGPSFHPEGLPLVEGLVEVVTEESSAAGERHEELADHVGQVVVFAWALDTGAGGSGKDPVRWIRAVDWLPYQMATFVTPAFAGYVSGHSTFSRAAAEAMVAFTGREHFPDGLLSVPIPADWLRFEDGPSRPFELQWATWRDAADEAGYSRIPGGIHIPADDVAGRRLGEQVGRLAWERAASLFGVAP